MNRSAEIVGRSVLKKVSETEFQNQVLDLAKLYRWLSYHTHDSRRSQAGFPDLTLVRSPRVIFAELKSLTGRMQPEQIEWQEQLVQCPGIEYYLWTPNDWDEIERVLGWNFQGEQSQNQT